MTGIFMKYLLGTVTILVVAVLGAFLFMYFSPRPPLTIDPATIGVTGRVSHVERVEQCGSRVVVTASGIIHD